MFSFARVAAVIADKHTIAEDAAERAKFEFEALDFGALASSGVRIDDREITSGCVRDEIAAATGRRGR